MADVLDDVNPIQGDPGRLQAQAQALGRVAEGLADTITELRSMRASTGMRGDAIAAYLEAAEAIEVELGLVEARYSATSGALASYATSLVDIQAEGHALRQQAQYEQQVVHSTAVRIAVEQDAAASAQPADLQAMLLPSLRQPTAAEVEHDAAVAALASYSRQFDALLERWQAVADARAREIDVVVNGSALNDSAWDKVAASLEWLLDEVIPDLETILDAISILLTVVAVALVFTGVGVAAAPALFALARAAQIGARVVAVVKAASTTALVVTGRRPVSALVDLGAELVLDKVAGKATDATIGLAARHTPGLVGRGLDAAGVGAISLTERVDDATLRVGFAAIRLRAVDFDGWVEGTMNAKVTAVLSDRADTLASRAAVELGSDVDVFDSKVDDLIAGAYDGLAGSSGGDSYRSLVGWLDRAAGPDHALNGMTYQAVTLAVELTQGHESAAKNVHTDQPKEVYV